MSGPPGSADGVVLAAGLGSRLIGQTQLPKPLVPVGGTPLIVRTLRSLGVAGCKKVVVVLGFEAERVRGVIEREHRGVAVEFVHNPDYQRSNGLSVLCAQPLVGPRFLLSMADHVFSDGVMKLAGQVSVAPGETALLVDPRLADIFDMDDATKVRVEAGKIREIGKQLTNYNAVDCGLFVATPGLMEQLAAVRAQKGDASLSDGCAALCRLGRMLAVDVGEGYWQDVDTPEMLAEVEARLAKPHFGR